MKRFITFATAASAIQVRKAGTDSGDASSMIERPGGQAKQASPNQRRTAPSFIQTASKRFLHKPIEPDTIVDDVDDQATSLVQYAFIF
jgi:hypothetical protein